MKVPRLPVGGFFEVLVDFVRVTFALPFDWIKVILLWVNEQLVFLLELPPFWLVAIMVAIIAYFLAGKRVALFTLAGLLFIAAIDLWPETIITLSLVIEATLLALLIGIPTGILAAKSDILDRLLHPVLDFMQTMPAFVYLIPAIMIFRMGAVPAVISTVIFAMPPTIRLTNLAIRQVPKELVEAGEAFGSNWFQMLLKVELPQALPTIMAGVNQCIMLSLSMVVIASMIGAGGLGSVVLNGLSNLDVGLGFEGGIAVVIIAIILDRLTQGTRKEKEIAH
ncbi:MAG: ABC transporter permease subunit [Firmicutes bacterium]|nr:ABC transporter permease subunit [Bacillota bacterium]